MLFFMTLLQGHERKCRFECCFETLSLIRFTSVTIGKYYFGTAKKQQQESLTKNQNLGKSTSRSVLGNRFAAVTGKKKKKKGASD